MRRNTVCRNPDSLSCGRLEVTRDFTRPTQFGGLRLLAFLFAVLAGTAWVGCDSPSGTGSHPATSPPPVADRIVSLTVQGTRFVRAIGAEDRLVAVDAASAAAAGFGAHAVVDASDVAAWAPDLVLAPSGSLLFTLPGAQLDLGAGRVIEFEPHDLEEVFELSREVGTLLVGPVEATRYEARLARPLAAIGGASFGRPRPRVLALVALDPPLAAGGHSFETDLVEIAGGRSVTHGGDAQRRPVTRSEVARWAPDRIVVMMQALPPSDELERVREALDSQVPIDAVEFEADVLWEGGLVPIAEGLARLLAGS